MARIFNEMLVSLNTFGAGVSDQRAGGSKG